MRQLKAVRSQVGGGSIAEFGPVLFIFFIVVFLPLLSLISLVEGVATLALCANQAAREAATATSFTQAQTNMQRVGQQIIGGPLGSFGNIIPKDTSGLTLTCLQIPSAGGSKQRFNYADRANIPIDTAANFYEFQVKAAYGIRPLLYPQTLSMEFVSASHVEHPNGLRD